jgi:hypothetical protein
LLLLFVVDIAERKLLLSPASCWKENIAGVHSGWLLKEEEELLSKKEEVQLKEELVVVVVYK